MTSLEVLGQLFRNIFISNTLDYDFVDIVRSKGSCIQLYVCGGVLCGIHLF